MYKTEKKSNTIIGAVIGDVIGSVFELNNIKTTEFDLFNHNCDFTDDTVLTIAVTDCILNKKDLQRQLGNTEENIVTVITVAVLGNGCNKTM